MKNVLLTGDPHCGKSTLLKKLISNVGNKVGFLTEEMCENGNRTGFKVYTSHGETVAFADTNFSKSFHVGKYGLDIIEFDKIIPKLLSYDEEDLLFVDEIGEMQLHSDVFKDLVLDYLNSSNPCLMSVSSVFDSEFINTILEREDVVLHTVTIENRDSLYESLL